MARKGDVRRSSSEPTNLETLKLRGITTALIREQCHHVFFFPIIFAQLYNKFCQLQGESALMLLLIFLSVIADISEYSLLN